MKLFFKSKDGGPESNVTGYWLVECKSLFSIVLLRFDKGSREAFHNHAFNSVSFILIGCLREDRRYSAYSYVHSYFHPSVKPLFTRRNNMHKVHGITDKTWVLSFRGPWSKTWREYLPAKDKLITLTNGRKIINNDTPKNSNNRQST